MNTPTEILVITNGKPVIVPADKWPKEPLFNQNLKGYYKEVGKTLTPTEFYERQKLEAIAQGAVVDIDSSNYGYLQLISGDTQLPLKDGAYPIDPSKWVVEKQWQVLHESGWHNFPDKFLEENKRSGNVRQIATIKPKADSFPKHICLLTRSNGIGCHCSSIEETLNCRNYKPKAEQACNCGENHCDTNGCSKRERHLVEDHLQQPAPAPTRKLAIDELIDNIKTELQYLESRLERRDSNKGSESKWILKSKVLVHKQIIALAQSIKEKEIENIGWGFIDGMVGTDPQRTAKDYLSKTYQL